MTRRRSALTSAGSTRRWRRLRAYVLDRDAHTCQWPGTELGAPTAWGRLFGSGLVCGAYASTVDHVTRRDDGGDDDPENLRAACSTHNDGRRDSIGGTSSSSGVNPPAPSSSRPSTDWKW